MQGVYSDTVHLRMVHYFVQVAIPNGKLNNFNEMMNDSLIQFVSSIHIKTNTN